MQLNTMAGTADIMGRVMNFGYEAGCLSLEVNLVEAHALIQYLEGQKLALVPGARAVAANAPPPPAPDHQGEPHAPPAPPPVLRDVSMPRVDPAAMQRIANGSPAPAPKPEKPPSTRAKRTPPPAAEPSNTEAITAASEHPASPGEPPAPPTAPAPEEPPPAADAPVEPPPAPKPSTVAAAPADHQVNGVSPKTVAKPAPAGDVPAELVNARKLKDIIVLLMKQGIKDKDGIKAECARLKASIPTLERITDLDGRIDRTWEVIDMRDEDA